MIRQVEIIRGALGRTRLTAAAAVMFLFLSTGAQSVAGLEQLDPGGQHQVGTAFYLPTAANFVGAAVARDAAGSHLLVVTTRTPPSINSSGIRHTGGAGLYYLDPKSSQIVFRLDSLGVESIAPPLPADVGGDGSSEIAIWGGGRFMLFGLNGTELTNVSIEADSNPFAPTPRPGLIASANGTPNFILAGRNGDLYCVDANGDLVWVAHLSTRPIVGEIGLIEQGVNSSPGAMVSDGSWGEQDSQLDRQGFTFAGNTTFLLDARTGAILNSIAIPGSFPLGPAAFFFSSLPLYVWDQGSRIPSVFVANDAGTIYQVSMGPAFKSYEVRFQASGQLMAFASCPVTGLGVPDLVVASRVSSGVNALTGLNRQVELWSRNVSGPLVRSLEPFMNSSSGAACDFVQWDGGLSLLSGVDGAKLSNLSAASGSALWGGLLDTDGDGWLEVVAAGPAIGAPDPAASSWIMVLDSPTVLLPASGYPSADGVDIFAGGIIWTRVNGTIGALPEGIRIATVVFATGPTPESVGATFSVQNGRFEVPAGGLGLLLSNASSLVIGATDIVFDLKVSVPWNYSGAPLAVLRIWIDTLDRSPLAVNFSLPLRFHTRLTLQPQLLINGTLGPLANDTWIPAGKDLHLHAGPPAYEGTSQTLTNQDFSWALSVVGMTVIPWLEANGALDAGWSFPDNGSPQEETMITLTSIIAQGPLLEHKWVLHIDRERPIFFSWFPSGASVSWFSANPVPILFRLCDNGSGIAINSLALMVGSQALGFEIGDVLESAPACVDLLAHVQLPQGVSEISATIRDNVGNLGETPRPLSVGLDMLGVGFSNASPVGWVNTRSTEFRTEVVSRGGSGVELSSIQVAVSPDPGALGGWQDAGLSGTAENASVRLLWPTGSEQDYFVVWSARSAAGGNASLSDISVVRVDLSPPVLLNASETQPQVTTERWFEWGALIADHRSGVDEVRTHIVIYSPNLTDPSSLSTLNATFLPAEHGTVLAKWSLPVFRGWNAYSAVLVDVAGNALNLSAFSRRSNEPPQILFEGDQVTRRVDAQIPFSAHLTVSDPDGDTFVIEVFLDGQSVDASKLDALSLLPGNHDVWVIATDQFGASANATLRIVSSAVRSNPALPDYVAVFWLLAASAAVVGVVALKRRRRRGKARP